MFHQGDLQSGIVLALQQAKSVVCFVRDNGDESNKWESDWLQDQNIPASLERNAVTIRMESGSQEAGFLSAFYPVSKVPVVVVIWQGKVEEQLAAGITKNHFTLRLLRALNRDASRDTPLSDVTAPAVSPAAAASTPQTDRQARIQALLAERKDRLEAEKKAREDAERQSRKENAKARDEARNADGTKTAQRKHAEQEKKRIAEAAAEKERVRRLVEADKAERRERQEHARALLESERRAELDGLKQAEAQDEQIKASRKGVAIQARLLNGEAIRGSFLPQDTPQKALRKWIDEQRNDGSAPYSLKVVQTPAPSRAITETEESKTLRELGLAPSASLVLVASRGAVATAYAGNSVFARTFTILALLLGVFGFIGNFISKLVAFGVRAAGDNVRRHEGPDAAPGADALAQARAGKKETPQGAGTRVRTLRDHDAERDDQQLYNGNQLNFQPRRDDEDDKEQAP